MNQSISIIVFISFFSVLSNIVWRILGRKNIDKVKFIKMFCFYFAVYYGIMTIVKLMLGHTEETLIESFWNVQMRTYVHYGIPMAGFAVIIPLFIKKIFKFKSWLMIDMLSSAVFAGVAVNLVCGIRVDNTVYGILFVLSIVISIVYTAIGKEETGKKDISLAVCAWGLWVVLTVISIPNELYLTNISEFPITYWRFLIAILIGGVVIVAVGIAGSITFLTPRMYKGTMLLVFGISVMGYIQSMFLNGELASMDGEVQVWSLSQRVINIVIWVIGLSAIFVLCYWKKSVMKLCKGICLYIIAIQLVSTVFLIITTDDKDQKIGEALTTQDALKISTGNNVIVFILDKFDGDTMDKILEEDKEFVQPLKDFVYYENATCQFMRTCMAIPYLLTGTDWPIGMSLEDYLPYAYCNSDTFQDITKANYRIGIYSDVVLMDDSVKQYTSNYSDMVERKCDIYGTVSTMTKCAEYRMAPFASKAYYAYYTSDIVENITDNEGVWNILNDIPFYEMLEQEGISYAEEYNEEGAFLFYHMYGPHPPFRMTEDLRIVEDWESSLMSQAKGSLKIVYRYLEQLKALGEYDDATIMIIADHGIQIEANEGNNPIPLILVKEAGNSQDTLQISDAPVSQKEFIPTIMEAMGIDRDKYGRTFEEVPADEINERMHANVSDKNTEDVYIIKGNAKNSENWSRISNVTNLK